MEVIVQLHSPQSHPVVYRGSRVSLQFGNKPALAPQPLTEDGLAAFSQLDRSWLDDTVRLTYLAKNGRPYRVIQQMFNTAADAKDRHLEFTIEIVPDTTHMHFSLKNKAGLITHAQVKIDNRITIETDDYGQADVFVPKTAGSTAHFIVSKDGKTLLEKDVVLTEEYQRLFVDE